MGEAYAALDRIEAEVRRLSEEVFELEAGNLVAFGLVAGPFGAVLARITDPLGLQQRAEVYKGFIGELEDFVGGTFARVEKEALAGDVDAARRLRDAAVNIAGAARKATPVDDLKSDVVDTVKQAKSDLENLVDKIIKAGGIALAVIVGLKVLSFLR